MKRYPAYRDSGVEWLGEVPEGWSAPELKRFAALVYGDALAAEIRDDDGEVPVYGSNGPVGTHSVPNGLGPVILVGRKGSYGALNWCDTDCFAIDTVYYIDKRHATSDLRWLFWALHLARFEGSSQDTGVPGLSRSAAYVTRLPLPPLPEQTAIAAFLDVETAKIDGLVAEQRRLIDLLREKRQAVISHAVTRGLNSHAKLKPSGIDWLGDVPEGWDVKRLSFVCDFEQGKAHEPYFDDDGEFICVTARFVSSSGEKAKRCSANLTPANLGDILMVMSDLPNGRALARAFLVDHDGPYAINQRVCRIHARAGDARYFYYQLNRHTELLSEDDGANQTHLSNSSFTKLKLLVPPIPEQNQISDFLDARLRTFDTLTATAESAIALLQERRAALISAAVTGKIDVRGRVPQTGATTGAQPE